MNPVICYSCFICMLTCSYLALQIFFRRGLGRMKIPDISSLRSVSVIVPCHNEEANLPGLFRCLEAQTCPADQMEIIFVDDRSTDATWDLMNWFASGKPNVRTIRITTLEDEKSPKKNALAQAIRVATGEIILTTDADTHPGPHWIDSMIRAFDEETGMVLGYAPYRTDGAYNTLFHKLLALEYFSMGAITAASTSLELPSTCNGANLAYRKSVFEEVGGFGGTAKHLSGDDDLFMHRVSQRTNWKIAFNGGRNSAVFNNPPENMRAFFRQRVRFASKHLAYPKSMIAILSLIYGFYLSLLVSMVFAFFSPVILGIVIIQLILKVIGDLCFLIPAQARLESRPLLKIYPLLLIPHIPYVVLFPLLGQILPKRW